MYSFNQFIKITDNVDLTETLDNVVNEDFADIVAKESGSSIEKISPSDLHKVPSGKQIYVKDSSGFWSIKTFDSSIHITDLHFALQRGKKVSIANISLTFGSHAQGAVSDMFGEMRTWGEVVNFVNANKNTSLDINTDTLRFNISVEMGHKIFSPWAISKIKRLKSSPRKWKMLDVVKALVNGQFKYVDQSYKLTDDYAFDAAFNHGKIKGVSALPLAIDMLSGHKWFIWSNDNEDGTSTVSFGPHRNQSFTMLFDVKWKHRIQVNEVISRDTKVDLKWEGDVLDIIVNDLEVDFSDATGIVMANLSVLQKGYKKKLSAKDVAKQIINLSENTDIDESTIDDIIKYMKQAVDIEKESFKEMKKDLDKMVKSLTEGTSVKFGKGKNAQDVFNVIDNMTDELAKLLDKGAEKKVLNKIISKAAAKLSELKKKEG